MTTYAELTTQILSYTETSTDVLTSTITDDFIEHTENRILREADIDAFKSHQYSALTSSNPFLSLPGASGIGATPTSLATIRTVHIYPASGTATRDFLEQRDISFMNEYWPVRTSTGTPKYWSWWDEDTIYVAPTPDAAYNIEIGITRLPTRLSSSNTTSWLGNNAPIALLYGCLAEAFKFLKGPAEMLQLYEQSYQRAIQELVIEQQGKHRRDEYMHGELKIPGMQTQQKSIGG
jgi:hypothetical protein|tara:strand:- start:3064 stop:3768 length:705 start_codon:yes stop_codon:yes gene_type:complete